MTIKQPTGQKRLLLSASASLPLIYLTESNKPSPMTAPNFCMLLRKHLQNGRIVNISQPGLERIVHIDIEHLDEMGDLRHKTLVMELMGKHSNLIFCNDDNTIIDSIKRVSAAVSSVREVLPGKPYFIAHTQDKLDALTCDETTFRENPLPPSLNRSSRQSTEASPVSPRYWHRNCATRQASTGNALQRH